MSSAAERQTYILHELDERGYVTVSTLSETLDVSEVTIRKDLKALEDRSLLHRVHGGANRIDPYVFDRPVEEKAKQHAEEKRRIGKAAADLVEENDTLLLASGTTMIQVGRHLRVRRNLTVITNAMNVAQELLRITDAEVLLLGGILRHTSASVVGPYAERILRDFACRKLFLGVDGFDFEYGLTTTNALEAHLNMQMIRAAQQTIIVADSSKFTRRGFSRICGVEDIDLVITDEGIPKSLVQQLDAVGVSVQIV